MIDITTEIFDSSIRDCQVAIYHFIKYNKWFTGKIYLLTTSTDYPTDVSINSIRKIYDNIEVINTSANYKFNNLLSGDKITRENIWKYCLLIDSSRILYMSNYSITLTDLSTIVTNSTSFISNNCDFIYINDNFDKSLINSSTSDIINAIRGIDNDFQLDSILLYSSAIPNRKYSQSINLLKQSKIIIFDTLNTGFSSSTRINSMRLHKVRETITYLSSPEAKVVLSPNYTPLAKFGIINSSCKNKIDTQKFGKFEILGSREYNKVDSLPSIHISIPTYNRKKYLHFLLNNISEYSHQYNITVFIYDDHSVCNYSDTLILLDSLNISYVLKRSTVNNGKEKYANVYNNIFLDIKNSSADYFIQTADDMMLVTDFFHRAISMLLQSGQDVLNLLLTHHHVKMFNKIGRSKINLNDLPAYTSSIDGAYIATQKFFNDIDYEIPIVPPARWIKNSLKGSGTSANILTKYRRSIFQIANESLFIHLGHDSALNPILRKTEILESVIASDHDTIRYTNALIELNKDTSYSIFNNKRIVFVGPSPDILLNSNDFGKLIDSYDIVVRTNNSYPITQNSEILGSKCDVIVLNNVFINSEKFNIDNYTNSNIKLIFEFGGLSKNNNYENFPKIMEFKSHVYHSINEVLNIPKTIDIKPFSGMLILSEILSNSPKELFVCGVSNYSKDTGTHIPGYLPSSINEDSVYTRQNRFHPNTANYQYKYFKQLLATGLITMDDFSKKYFI